MRTARRRLKPAPLDLRQTENIIAMVVAKYEPHMVRVPQWLRDAYEDNIDPKELPDAKAREIYRAYDWVMDGLNTLVPEKVEATAEYMALQCPESFPPNVIKAIKRRFDQMGVSVAKH